VKQVAMERGLPIFQPENLGGPEPLAHLAAWRPDAVVVAAFGQLLPVTVLDLPPHGCLNVHASLLPRYRGAAPIAAAILSGDAVTGITIMRMDEGLDTGPILAQAECPIAHDDTTGSMTDKLAELGADLLLKTLDGWLAGTVEARPQDDAQATYCSQLEKEDGLLDWLKPAAYLDRQIGPVIRGPGHLPAGRARGSRCCAPGRCPAGKEKGNRARYWR